MSGHSDPRGREREGVTARSWLPHFDLYQEFEVDPNASRETIEAA